MEKIKYLEEKILWALDKYPETRNDDVLLTLRIIENYAPYLVKYFENKPFIALEGMNWCREDHVKRIRAKIQNEQGLFPPTDEVVKKRRGYQQTWRNYNFESYPQQTIDK